MPGPYPGRPVVVVDANGNQIIPVVSALSTVPLAIQAHDPTGGPYAMCQYLSGGAPIKSSDYAIFFPGGFSNGAPSNNLFAQVSGIHRIPTWFNWLTANNFVAGTNGVTTTAFSAEPASSPSPSTQPYTTITGLVSGDAFAYNPENGHTAAAEMSAMASTMSTAISDGLANSPSCDVWWVTLSSIYTTQVATIGPTVNNAIYQAQNIPQASWQSSVKAAIAAGHAANANLKVWIQGLASSTSGFFGNLNALAASGTTPDGIVILTETSSTSSYLKDLQTLVNQLRP